MDFYGFMSHANATSTMPKHLVSFVLIQSYYSQVFNRILFCFVFSKYIFKIKRQDINT